MAPQTVASLAEQCHEFQDKVADDIAPIETQLSKLSSEQKEELVQVHKHLVTTDLAINKLQDSVQMLINHFRAGKVEPSSTSAVLSSLSTPQPKSGLLPNPPVDQKLKAVPYDMPHTSTGLSLSTPEAQLDPLFSFGSMSTPHYTQHTAGPPPMTTQAPTPPPVRHDQYTHLPCHFDNDVIRHIGPTTLSHIKLTALTFDGRGDPTMFLDWVQAMEDYFAWFNLTDAHKLRIGKMALRGATRQYWNSMEEQLYQFGRPPVTLWDEMKLKLREQYVPTFYLEQLFDQLWTISQGNSTITEYHARFIKQKGCAGIREEPGITVSRFIHGLHNNIKHEVCRFDPHCLEDAYCHTLEAETYFRPQHSGYSGQPATANQTLPTTGMQMGLTGFSGPSNPTAPPPNKGPAVSTNARIECFPCHAKGHIASRCPQRTLTINTPDSELCEIVEPLKGVYDPNIND
ncbi:hypothetical protein ACE6H2_016439 [Prunus campanulata]